MAMPAVHEPRPRATRPWTDARRRAGRDKTCAKTLARRPRARATYDAATCWPLFARTQLYLRRPAYRIQDSSLDKRQGEQRRAAATLTKTAQDLIPEIEAQWAMLSATSPARTITIPRWSPPPCAQCDPTGRHRSQSRTEHAAAAAAAVASMSARRIDTVLILCIDDLPLVTPLATPLVQLTARPPASQPPLDQSVT